MHCLNIYDSQKNLTSRYVMTREAIVIGRDPSCGLSLSDINISRKHARIEPMGRFYVVRDLKSTNGTWVNENPIKMHLLKNEDVIRIGHYRLVVEVTSDQSARRSEQDLDAESCHTDIIDNPFAYDQSPDSSHTLRIDVGKETEVKLRTDRQTRERFQRLHEISRKLGFIETPAVLCGQVVETVLEELKADRASLLIPEEEGFRTVSARVDPAEKGRPFNIHNGILRSAVDGLSAILTEDAAQDQRFRGNAGRPGDRVRSVMCVPLMAQTNLQGLIYVDRTSNPQPFTEDDLRFLAVIGNQVAINLANARLFEEVLTEKQKVQGVISSLKDGLMITDQELVVQRCNAAAADILFPQGGYPVGKNLLKLLMARDPTLDQGELENAVGEGKDFSLLAERGPEVRAYAVSVAALSPSEEERAGFVFSLRDTTDLLHLQELKSEFIRNASHKLRTPLTILMGSLDVLRSLPVQKPLETSMESVIKGMERNLQQLEGLVSRFLEFAELDRMHFKLREVNLREAVAVAEAGTISRAQEKKIQIINRIPAGEELIVQADTDRLVQCLHNILDNAIKFAPEGSTVHIDSEVGDTIRVHIEDEGPGIPPGDLQDIFSGFHQVEKMPTGEVPGAGLGLTISKRIIHAHSGSISAMSPSPRSGKGTVITISLPRPVVSKSRRVVSTQPVGAS